MDYRERFKKENQAFAERRNLSVERIRQIVNEDIVSDSFVSYFRRTAQFLLQMDELYDQVHAQWEEGAELEQLQDRNEALYEDILGNRYEVSYANPAYAVQELGESYGPLLCFLYKEIRGLIVPAFEQQLSWLVRYNELFVEVYNCFEQEDVTEKEVKQILYWFISDYSDEMIEQRILEQLDPELSFATDLVMQSDLSDLRYLYRFGEYVSENERGIAAHLAQCSVDEIEKMASTFTEGYRLGFVNTNKDLSKKETVNIRYHLGFERIVRQAVKNFEKMGLRVTLYRQSPSSVHNRVGYESAQANKQYVYDHRNDRALYLDKAYVERRIGALKTAYEKHRELAAKFAGPACMEVFGEEPFAPKVKKEAWQYSKKQQKLAVELANASGQIVNEYIHGEERSFTIIAFPLPEIGEPFTEIFNEIVRINTLDYRKYQKIQQTLIDTLDQGETVQVRGMNGNHTNLRIALHPLEDASKETIFENCVADVNIPVGEVFTSPQLKGTSGCLHVSHVYLNELEYRQLEVEFEDGMICGYHCQNFDSEEENQRYIEENLLFHHATLPMGEFAIGTNTVAYVVTQKYNLAAKMPILIAEKMGPHFAVGDTCYSWQEETSVYNPDGKEIIARDNEVSLQRKEDLSKAYFNCHTDITIPYDELGSLSVITKEKREIDIIKEGRFVLEGTQALNEAFQ